MQRRDVILSPPNSVKGFDRPWGVHATRGCESVSSGCDVCVWRWLAENNQKRFHPGGFENVRFNERSLWIPKKRKRPTWYRLSPHADMFQTKISDKDLITIFQMIADNKRHLFQTTTKYTHRMKYFLENVLPEELAEQCDNLMLGVNIETQEYAWRAYDLNAWPHTKFVECKPILGPVVDVDLSVIDWVVIASHYSRRIATVKVDWILGVVDMARSLNVPVSVDWISSGSGMNRFPHVGGKIWMQKPIKYLKWRERNESEWFKSRAKT